MSKMKDIRIQLTPEEHRKLYSLKGDRTLRELLLDSVGVEFEVRRLGRPPRVASHAMDSDSAITDSHTVRGLGEDQVFEKAQRQRERLKRGF